MTHQCDTGSWLFRMVMHFGGKLILLHCLVSLLMKGAFMQSYSFNIRIVIKRSPALPRMEKTNRFFIFSLSLSLCPSSHFKHERLGSGSDSDWILVFVDCWPDKKGFQKKKFVFSSWGDSCSNFRWFVDHFDFVLVLKWMYSCLTLLYLVAKQA